jgi:hypothetical protein
MKQTYWVAFAGCVGVLLLIAISPVAADASCDATLIQEQIPLTNFAHSFWRDFDNHTMMSAFYGWDFSQKLASATSFGSIYWNVDSRFTVVPGTDISGITNLVPAMALLTFFSGGEHEANGDTKIACESRLNYTMTRTSQRIAKDLIDGPGVEVTLLGYMRLTITRATVNSPFKMDWVYNQINARIVETPDGASVWVPSVNAKRFANKRAILDDNHPYAAPGWTRVNVTALGGEGIFGF